MREHMSLFLILCLESHISESEWECLIFYEQYDAIREI